MFYQTHTTLGCTACSVNGVLRNVVFTCVQEFGVCPLLSVEDMIQRESVDSLAMLSYLTQLKDALENERPPKSKQVSF